MKLSKAVSYVPKTKREYSNVFEGSHFGINAAEHFEKQKKSQTPMGKNVQIFEENNDDPKSYTARYLSKRTDSIGRISRSESEKIVKLT